MVNKVFLLGNLGADPELRTLPGGDAVCSMRVATSRKWTGKDGQSHEETEWHSVETFGKTAENCAQYLAKGRQVFVEGRLRTRSWEDKATGQKRYKTEVVAENVRFLGARAASGGTASEVPPGPPGDSRTDAVPF